MGRPSKYPDELRREAVELVRSSGRSMPTSARSLGISDAMLGNWVSADREARARAADSPSARRVRAGGAEAPPEGERGPPDGRRDPPQGCSVFRPEDEPMTGYRFVSSHEDLYPIEKLCENVGVLAFRLLRLGGPRSQP